MDLRFISELAKRISLDKTAFDKAIYELENNLDGVLYIKENASLSNMKPFVKALKKDREKGAPVCLAAALLISSSVAPALPGANCSMRPKPLSQPGTAFRV